MTRRHYGALYLVTPGQPDDPDRRHERVIETYEDARSHIDVARELWSLAGDDARAGAIAAVVDRAYERESRTLAAADVDELLALVDGLEDALARTITDKDLNIRDEHLVRVRQRARLIDVDEARGSLASYAVLEGVSRVSALRHILRTARERSMDVALD
ncbi:MAG: hypothetical protein ACRDMZ_04545 [Solirubrobacteraceae bacterium]